MTTLLLVIAILALASAVGLVRAIRRDGLGDRLPPTSHEAWRAGPYASTPASRR